VSDVIELRELRLSAVVGVLREERDRAQPLALDIDVHRPFEEAAMNDDLSETTDYAGGARDRLARRPRGGVPAAGDVGLPRGA
jgi:FolB domain-containing protein